LRHQETSASERVSARKSAAEKVVSISLSGRGAGAVRLTAQITDRLKSPIRCLFDNNEVKLNCTTSMGRASDQLDVEMTGQSVEIGFNNRYLLEALRNTECDEVKVQLGGPLSPMKVVPKEGDSFLFLVLPVRLKSE